MEGPKQEVVAVLGVKQVSREGRKIRSGLPAVNIRFPEEKRDYTGRTGI